MQSVSSLPFLCAGLAAFWIWLGVHSYLRGHINMAGLVSIAFWITSLTAWGVTSVYLALNGTYTSASFYAVMPGLWWPMIPAVITVVHLALPSFRTALFAVVSQNSRALICIQALRIAAIGGVVKGFNGVLPPSFALPVGIPDMVFGLSALALTVLWPKEGWAPRTLIAWNLIGLGVILPAPLLMQLGLPGPFHVFTSSPDARALFEYPMVLAPTLVVPLFITLNAIHATVLWMKGCAMQGGTVCPKVEPPAEASAVR